MIIGIAALFYRVCSGAGLTVTPDPSQLVTSEGDVINLLCKASERPSICLWKTPYQAIYSVGGGRIWEQGRLSSSPLAEGNQCGLVIAGIQPRDRGVWQCEVGAVVDGEFTTTTARTTISIIDRAGDTLTSRLLGLEGDQITIPCLGNGKLGVCRWSSPYGQSYSLMPGDYAERGRILTDDRCGLRISSLQGRDEGEWTCQVGDGRVSQKTTRVTIETPLKLSAPTSILQQADERATLVCHANKEYGRCEWETPYGRTVSFSKDSRQAESGRLQYFGFSDMDCGIVIKDIGPRDSGGWTCRVSANIAGKEQISADIVRLFVEPTQYEDQREEPRSIQSSPPDYTIDYRALDYNQDESKMDDYDAFDYVNGDFDKVVKGSDDYDQDTNNREIFPTSSKSPPRVVANPTLSATSKSSTSKPEVLRTIEEDDGFIREIQKIGKFGTVRIDRIPDRVQRITTTSTTPFVAFRDEPRSFKDPPSTSPPISNTHQNFPVFSAVDEKVEDHTSQSSLNPSELDFLELISGSRVDNRPFRIHNSSQFGIRQSSVSGSRFQFGDIHLVGNNANLPVNDVNEGQSDEGHTRERGGNVREFVTDDAKDENNIERPVGRQKVRIRTQVKSPAEKEREKEVEERARIAEEELNRDRLRQIEDRKQQRLLEEEERRIKLRKLREQQIEESRKLQKERERKRLEAELAKKRQEEEEAAKIEADKRKAEEKRQTQLEEERKRKLAIEKLQKEREKQLQEERERRLQVQIDKLKKEREEQRKLELEEIEKQKLLKEQKAIEEERHKKVLEERERQLREERERRIQEERERKRKEDIERKRKEEKDKRQKEERERRLKEEKERERKREEDKIRRQKAERERFLKEQEEKAILEEEIKEQEALKEKKKQVEAEREKDELKEIEERRKLERERIRQELQDQRKKEEQEERRKKLQEDRQRRINEEKERIRQEEIRKIQEDNERATKLQKEAERRLQIQRERIQQDELENERKELEEKKKKQEEEERLIKIQKAHEEKLKRERERLREEAKERRRKEHQELEEIKKRDEERRKEIQLLKELQAERDRSFQEEREKKRKEIEEEKKKKEEELEMTRKREEARSKELEKLKTLQLERDRLLKEERDRVRKENEVLRQKEEEENEKLKQQAIERKKEIESLRALQLQREGQLKEERERIRKQKAELEKQQLELQRQKELLEQIRNQNERKKQTTTTQKPLPTPVAEEGKKCLINPWPASGNITCSDSPLARGQYIVKSGNKCHLNCKKGFVTLDAKETVCQNGQWSHKLYCVLPGAMLVVGGRSDTYGVLSSVELVTSGGVCRNIVPNLPTMRWKMVSASIDEDTVVACGGINFLGDPKTDCWRLDFSFSKPRWTAMQSLSIPRDAAAWAAEQGKLFVMGGSLGTLSGYTASTEVYDPKKDEWVIGKSLTSTRASHCAVGDGAGHIIVTGGYGALQSVQRLDIKSGVWTNLPDLQPVRAQHGCAFVELMGKKGVIIVGGDSGGTRLNDVRFLSLDQSNPTDWTKIADLNTARWGRPSVGLIGGKITVIGGWDGVKALNSVEFYNEKNERWETSRRTKLSTERRWAASAQVSNKLFPTCVQKRS